MTEYLNRIFLCEVSIVHNYGAFVKIPGGKVQGLVHRTQVSSTQVEDASQVLQKGDRVWCKVIKITDDGKLSLSMKVVDQGKGTDLDPNGVTIHQDEQRRRTRPDYTKKNAIKLEAVLNTTCTKCGTRGHIANDCFKRPDGKVYELIPDDDEDDVDDNVTSSSSTTTTTTMTTTGRVEMKSKKSTKKKKAKKKEKKSKRKRKKRSSSTSSQSSSSSSSSSSEEEAEKSRKRKKKRSRSRKCDESSSRYDNRNQNR